MFVWAPGYSGRDRVLLVHGPRLGIALLCMLVSGWFASAAVVWKWQHRRGFHSVTYASVVQPWCWSEMRRTASHDQVELARGLMDSGDDLKALWNLLAAVRRNPSDREGARLLGAVLVRNLMINEALESLHRGLGHFEPDAPYFQLLLDTAARAEDYEAILEVTQRYWPSGKSRNDPEISWLLASRHGLALVQLARWSEAVAWCRTVREQASDTVSLVDIEAYALIKLGRAKEARTLLHSVPMARADHHSDLVRLLAEALYQLDDDQGFRTALLMYLQLHQGDPSRYLDVLAFCADKPRLKDEFGGALRAYYKRFGRQEDALSLLAGFLLAQQRTADLEQLLARVRDEHFNTQTAETALAECLLHDGRLAECDTILRSLPVTSESNLAGFRLALLRRTLSCLQSKQSGADTALLDFLGRRRLPLDDSLALAGLLVRHGRSDTAEHILLLAKQAYPHSPRISEQLASLKAQQQTGRIAGSLLQDRP